MLKIGKKEKQLEVPGASEQPVVVRLRRVGKVVENPGPERGLLCWARRCRALSRCASRDVYAEAGVPSDISKSSLDLFQIARNG